MEVAESTEPTPVGHSTEAEATATNGEQVLSLGMDDSRSSSLSEISDVSEHEPSDYEPIKPERPPMENDSEAETERLEESPNNIRLKRDIVVSASGVGPSPSKLAQSTTYDDVEEEEEEDEEEEGPAVDDSPSKPRSKSNGVPEVAEETPAAEESTVSDSAGKKRKRLGSIDDTGTDLGEDEPLKKRRGSIKSELSEPPADASPLSPEPAEESLQANQDLTPAEEIPEPDLPAVPVKTKKGKKGKRKTRRTRDADEETEVGGNEGEGADDNAAEDEDTAGRGDELDDAETTAKHEEESVKKMSAFDSLAELENEFASLRDKIYDERISKLNRELEMLQGPNPTHPEYLRQLECITQHRDAKLKFERTLFQYRTNSLLTKSLAERAQSHSTYFQRVRDLREKYSAAVSKQFYAIQHDRFKTEEISPHHSIPFPTRRADQVSHQAAYSQEVSILSGVSKYVGFPAAPDLSSARPTELEGDMEKMGISTETRAPAPQPPPVSRAPMSAMATNFFRTAAEEAFLEQTPWANPQHPIHQQQQMPQATHSQVFERAPPFTTPAAQKRVVDVNAPNGSASTIPENGSAANSSTNNTPFGLEQDPQSHSHRQAVNPDYDADRRFGFRSLSSSPLDTRRPPPSSNAFGHHRSVPEGRSDTSRNPAYSPPSARLGLFPSNRDSSPPLSSKPTNSMHPPNQMAAR